MKRLAILFAILPGVALAHPGGHAQNGVLTNLAHLLTEPDHLLMLAEGAALIGLAMYLRKGRNQ